MEIKNIKNALIEIEKIKAGDLKKSLNNLEQSCKGKQAEDIITNKAIFDAAITIKKASAQINEIVHAYGIINCLPSILKKDEKIINLSLASGATGEGIDLETNFRLAEFKFSEWQQNNANGLRKRAVLADLVSLFIKDDNRKKELYVYDSATIKKYFQSKKAKWEVGLSKQPELLRKLKDKNIKGEYIYNIFEISNVDILDINDFMSSK